MQISVITVNLNNREGLERTIRSVVSQTIFSQTEYIVVDGGSKDGSVESVKSFGDKISHWVSEPDRGIYHAMNKGIEMAKGEYLLFLNSGDVLYEEDTLLKVSKQLGSHDIVYGDLIYDRNSKLSLSRYPDRVTFDYLYQSYLPHPASFIKRETLVKLGVYDETYKICADWVFFMRAICRYSVSYLHIDQVISVYNTEGISAQVDQQETIKKERNHLLSSEFSAFIADYEDYHSLKSQLTRWEKKRLFRWLKKLKYLKIDQ